MIDQTTSERLAEYNEIRRVKLLHSGDVYWLRCVVEAADRLAEALEDWE